MKQYQLIKEYPGSPRLGTINSFANGITFELHIVENQPEFWEEVIKKNYEIIDYYLNSFLVKNVAKCDYESLQKMYEDCIKITIKTVKRLSDGEIFTIGDKINNKHYNHSLDKITVYNDKILLQHDFIDWKLNHNFEDTYKSKQPLFTTEDGVDIFEGGFAYEISRKNVMYSSPNRFTALIQCKDSYIQIGHDWVVFSTKEKAEEYILMNKPCLSIKDIEKVMKYDLLRINGLKNVVKSKLNLS